MKSADRRHSSCSENAQDFSETANSFDANMQGEFEDNTEISQRDCIGLSDPFYHGLLPRVDVEPLLKDDGDFLIRKTEFNDDIILTLEVRHRKIWHFIINQDGNNMFYVESHRKRSVAELIQWHMKTRTPISEKSGAILKHGVKKPDWILNPENITMVKKLGEGAFGEVYLAEYLTPNGSIENVAVKTMREHANREARMKFMKEARIMRKFSHPNIIKIFGISVYEQPLLIVMEVCPKGSALTFLRRNRGRVSASTKLRLCVESAAGLAYLESKNCIHRDIAARNCLLNANYEVKISDFGMSDEVKMMRLRKLDKVPIKWLAPETMQMHIYSIKTDIWSYGIMVWEIYSEGCEPYPNLSNAQTRAKIIVQNYRMVMPKDTPPLVSQLIELCWTKEPESRPTFKYIRETLQTIRARLKSPARKTKP